MRKYELCLIYGIYSYATILSRNTNKPQTNTGIETMSKTTSAAAIAETAAYQMPSFVVASHVTVPLLKLDLNVTRYVTILTPIAISAPIGGKDGDEGKKKDMEPAKICRVTNLEDGRECEIIVPAVLSSILEEKYVSADYVGKSFAITKTAVPSDGKRYSRFSLDEIRLV